MRGDNLGIDKNIHIDLSTYPKAKYLWSTVGSALERKEIYIRQEAESGIPGETRHRIACRNVQYILAMSNQSPALQKMPLICRNARG